MSITRPAWGMRRRSQVAGALHTLVLLFFAFVFLAPLWIMWISSLKADEFRLLTEMGTWRVFVPTQPSLQNYFDVFRRMPFHRFLFNSTLIVTNIVLWGLVVNSMAGYALARLNWWGRSFVLGLIVALIIIPFEGVAVPLLLIVNRLGWVDSYRVQIVPFIAHPFSIYLFYQFFIGLPRDFDEAALVDGASRFRIYWNIILPLSKPVLATVAILQFLEYWGSFLWPLMVTRGFDYRPLTVGMQTFFGQWPREWGDIMAFATMMTVPTLVIFVAFQRWFIQSVASAGVKG